METFPRNLFKFGEVRIVGDVKGAGLESWMDWEDLVA